MFRSIFLLLILIFCIPALTVSGQSESKDSDLQALKADSQRMRVMLNQLRNNLAFVDTTQSPLKHQFQLEADMWQILLDQMDKRIAKMEQAGVTK